MNLKPIKMIIQFAFSDFSLFFIVVYDALTGASSETTAKYWAKYGVLASPKCW